VCTGLGASLCTMLLMAASGWILMLLVVLTYKLRMRLRVLMQPPFTTTWDYATSTNQWNGGKHLDVFLILNLNVIFKEVKEVTWTNITCARFALDSQKNKPMIGLSQFDVDNVEIPELTRLGDQSQVNMTSMNC